MRCPGYHVHREVEFEKANGQAVPHISKKSGGGKSVGRCRQPSPTDFPPPTASCAQKQGGSFSPIPSDYTPHGEAPPDNHGG